MQACILATAIYDLEISTSMPFRDALREVSDGIVIDLEVTPGSKHTCIPSGYNPWRKRIEVKLSQAAQKGKANEQLIEQLAVLFSVTGSTVSIISGAKSSQKSILVKTVSMDFALSVLGKKLLQNEDDDVHRCEVVIEQDDRIKRRGS